MMSFLTEATNDKWSMIQISSRITDFTNLGNTLNLFKGGLKEFVLEKGYFSPWQHT